MNYSKNGQDLIRLALEKGLKTVGELAIFLKTNYVIVA